jgi:hypothetical protein
VVGQRVSDLAFTSVMKCSECCNVGIGLNYGGKHPRGRLVDNAHTFCPSSADGNNLALDIERTLSRAIDAGR